MRRTGRAAPVALLIAVALAGCTSNQGAAPSPGPWAEPSVEPAIGPDNPVVPERPNMVLILMDDFSMDLLKTMRHAKEMARRGASYPNAFVVDSLCCVSRASLMTGQFPHQTGVLTNSANMPNEYGPIGGWQAFSAYGNLERSVNVRLQEHGYATGFVGKYLNEYELRPGRPAPPIPPGWTDWNAVLGSAYGGWGFVSTYVDDGELRVRRHRAPPLEASDQEKDDAYAGAVTSGLALDFIRRHQPDEAPYLLEIAPYAPHGRVSRHASYPGDPVFPPAFRDRPRPGHPQGNCGAVRCDDLGLRELPGYGDDVADNAPRWPDGTVAPAWRPEAPHSHAATWIGQVRDRARMVQSIDRMLGRVLAAVDDNSYVVLTSDNGFHLGQHGLGGGKGTAYDSDVHVPLLVVGPDVLPGARHDLVTNIDLAPTFEDLAGLQPAAYRSGRSLTPSLLDRPDDGSAGQVLAERDTVIIEHTWAPSLAGDPDQPSTGGNIDLIPSYVAARSRTGLLVRLDLDPGWQTTSWAWEYYDYRVVGWERTNAYADPRYAGEVAALRRAITRFDRCGSFTRDDAVPPRCR
jgi:N-acetylglucosamine-6-sulfatase